MRMLLYLLLGLWLPVMYKLLNDLALHFSLLMVKLQMLEGYWPLEAVTVEEVSGEEVLVGVVSVEEVSAEEVLVGVASAE